MNWWEWYLSGIGTMFVTFIAVLSIGGHWLFRHPQVIFRRMMQGANTRH